MNVTTTWMQCFISTTSSAENDVTSMTSSSSGVGSRRHVDAMLFFSEIRKYGHVWMMMRRGMTVTTSNLEKGKGVNSEDLEPLHGLGVYDLPEVVSYLFVSLPKKDSRKTFACSGVYFLL